MLRDLGGVGWPGALESDAGGGRTSCWKRPGAGSRPGVQAQPAELIARAVEVWDVFFFPQEQGGFQESLAGGGLAQR